MEMNENQSGAFGPSLPTYAQARQERGYALESLSVVAELLVKDDGLLKDAYLDMLAKKVATERKWDALMSRAATEGRWS